MIQVLDLQFLNHANVIAAFSVETEEGLILLETGPYSTFEHLSQLLIQKGYQISDVKHVFLTHIHLDHAGAAWAFAQAGAKIYVHPLGQKHLHQPEKLWNSAKMIYQDKMEFLWGAMQGIAAEQLQVVQHGETFSVGEVRIQGWHTPGHAVHHIAWQIEDALICGDVAGVRIGNGIVIPPCPPPDINIEDWQHSLRLIRSLPIKKLYLTHYGVFTDVDTHLSDLEKRLLDYANWILPYFEAQKSPQEITPLFQQYVREALLKNGIREEEQLLLYENANPSWMSVSGLLRYWQKKRGN